MWRVGALLLGLSGCSFVFVPRVHAERPDDCNPSRVTPVGDLVLGTLELVMTMGLMTTTETTSCFNNDCETHDVDYSKPAMVVGTIGFVQLISSTLGFIRTSECRRVRARAWGPPP